MSYKSDKPCQRCYQKELFGDDNGGFFICRNCGEIQQPTIKSTSVIIVEFCKDESAQVGFALDTTDMKSARKIAQALKKKQRYPRSWKAYYYRSSSVADFMWKHHRPAGF